MNEAETLWRLHIRSDHQPPQFIERFYHATRAALMKELLAGVGEPVTYIRMKLDQNQWVPGMDYYTADQMAAAVLRAKSSEMERILNLPTIKGNLFAERNIKEQP